MRNIVRQHVGSAVIPLPYLLTYSTLSLFWCQVRCCDLYAGCSTSCCQSRQSWHGRSSPLARRFGSSQALHRAWSHGRASSNQQSPLPHHSTTPVKCCHIHLSAMVTNTCQCQQSLLTQTPKHIHLSAVVTMQCWTLCMLVSWCLTSLFSTNIWLYQGRKVRGGELSLPSIY